jgi:hypothetical protein
MISCFVFSFSALPVTEALFFVAGYLRNAFAACKIWFIPSPLAEGKPACPAECRRGENGTLSV